MYSEMRSPPDDEVRFEFSSWWGWTLAFEAVGTEASPTTIRSSVDKGGCR
jgi:hypothetical protein